MSDFQGTEEKPTGTPNQGDRGSLPAPPSFRFAAETRGRLSVLIHFVGTGGDSADFICPQGSWGHGWSSPWGQAWSPTAWGGGCRPEGSWGPSRQRESFSNVQSASLQGSPTQTGAWSLSPMRIKDRSTAPAQAQACGAGDHLPYGHLCVSIHMARARHWGSCQTPPPGSIFWRPLPVHSSCVPPLASALTTPNSKSPSPFSSSCRKCRPRPTALLNSCAQNPQPPPLHNPSKLAPCFWTSEPAPPRRRPNAACPETASSRAEPEYFLERAVLGTSPSLKMIFEKCQRYTSCLKNKAHFVQRIMQMLTKPECGRQVSSSVAPVGPSGSVSGRAGRP